MACDMLRGHKEPGVLCLLRSLCKCKQSRQGGLPGYSMSRTEEQLRSSASGNLPGNCGVLSWAAELPQAGSTGVPHHRALRFVPLPPRVLPPWAPAASLVSSWEPFQPKPFLDSVRKAEEENSIGQISLELPV